MAGLESAAPPQSSTALGERQERLGRSDRGARSSISAGRGRQGSSERSDSCPVAGAVSKKVHRSIICPENTSSSSGERSDGARRVLFIRRGPPFIRARTADRSTCRPQHLQVEPELADRSPVCNCSTCRWSRRGGRYHHLQTGLGFCTLLGFLGYLLSLYPRTILL